MEQKVIKTKRIMPSNINFACVPHCKGGKHFLEIYICSMRKFREKGSPPLSLSLLRLSFLKNEENWLPGDKYVALAIQAIISDCDISVGPLEILGYPSKMPFGKHFGFIIEANMQKGGDDRVA